MNKCYLRRRAETPCKVVVVVVVGLGEKGSPVAYRGEALAAIFQ